MGLPLRFLEIAGMKLLLALSMGTIRASRIFQLFFLRRIFVHAISVTYRRFVPC